ncbi:beta strand repeat-containing protein, partial [Pandoraea anapnoica]|uniref:beta strand repeat-containing protein n=1 Tax=Pandoraea anapnoica TaxID=2508301 RepID=UPI001C2CF822
MRVVPNVGFKAVVMAVLCALAPYAAPAFSYQRIDSGVSVDVPGVEHGSLWDVNDDLIVLGQLNVNSGGTVTNLNADINAGGTVTVSGVGSIWNSSTGYLYVGDGGAGTLNINNGGQVTQTGNTFAIGFRASGVGTVTVNGQGSKLTSSDDFEIGRTGAGTLNIEDGGTVDSRTTAVIGNNGDGVATVTGRNSNWTHTGTFSIAQFGTGTLTIAEGGMVSVQGQSRVDIASGAGSTGVLNIGAAPGSGAVAPGELQVDSVAFGAMGGGTGTINFNHTGDHYFFGADISSYGGTATINQIAGTTIFTGDDSGFSGITNVKGGTLLLGNGSKLGGTLNVMAGGTFGGDGVVQGGTSFASGSTLYGQSGQQLTFQNNLVVPDQVNVVLSGGPSTRSIFNVQGDLNLGTSQLNIVDGSAMDVGVYRIFDYSGALTGTMTIGNVSEGDGSFYQLQTQQQGQVNLVSTFGRQFFFWNGSTLTGDGTIHGGNGTWNGTTTNWTGADGQINTKWSGNGFAVFSNGDTPTSKGGVVTIDSG